MRLIKLAILSLAAFGGYTLWNQYGARLTGRIDGSGAEPDRRVYERSLTVTERAVGSDDPVAQTTAILADSHDRSDLAPDAPGIERRRSEDTVEP